jgi:hypothetical protein
LRCLDNKELNTELLMLQRKIRNQTATRPKAAWTKLFEMARTEMIRRDQ